MHFLLCENARYYEGEILYDIRGPLAAGEIGANGAIFSFADALSLRSLPVPRPAQRLAAETSYPRWRTAADAS